MLVLYGSAVGGLGLLDKLAFGGAHQLAGGMDPGAARLLLWGAPAVSSRWRSFLRVSDGCWWA